VVKAVFYLNIPLTDVKRTGNDRSLAHAQALGLVQFSRYNPAVMPQQPAGCIATCILAAGARLQDERAGWDAYFQMLATRKIAFPVFVF
jgi:hypothetical protein